EEERRLVCGHEIAHAHRSSSAPLGTPSALVTSAVRAPGTCAVDFPRSCRTPSLTRLNPWMYASESEPPLVFKGRRPPGASSAPPPVNAAPSPRAQKP